MQSQTQQSLLQCDRNIFQKSVLTILIYEDDFHSDSNLTEASKDYFANNVVARSANSY